jgi:LysR family transcriptional regulator, hydrogen peroxide-inducible genes activator
MEMHQVRYFLALADTLNFTRAAERCNVSQPSLTRAIQGLEGELGGPLFHRERSHTHLTELGRMMLPHLQQVWDESVQAKHRAKDFVQLKTAALKIGVMCTISPHLVIDLFQSFQHENPGVELFLHDGKGTVLQEQLAKGEVDIAIYAQPEPMDEERFHVLPLYRERYMITMSPRHPLSRKNAIRRPDLEGDRYLQRVNCEYADYARAIVEKQGVKVVRCYRSERDDWILAMIKAGLGHGFTPEFCASAMEGVVALPLIDPEIVRTVNLVTVRGRPHSPPVGAFVRAATRNKWPGRVESKTSKAEN